MGPEGQSRGPLHGLKVVEFAGIGPGPFAVMLLSDLGAEVLRIDREGSPGASRNDPTARGRASLALDLKAPESIRLCLEILAKADVLIEGFRPGVMERLGLGPDEALAANPRLIYGRMTGWGQTGPLAHAAGHDINYIALTGALAAIGPKDGPPTPPLNLVGDYGGGSLYLVMGVLAALYERERSGRGQVIDAAVVDGAASMMSIFTWMEADGVGRARRGGNILDGSAPFYRCYRCADGKYVSVGAFEPKFYDLLLAKLGLEPEDLTSQYDTGGWDAVSARFAEIFARRTRAEWTELLEGEDVCFAPVLELAEAPDHPHMRERDTFTDHDGLIQPAPAPRFSRTPGRIQGRAPAAGEGGEARLQAWGVKPSHL